MTTFCGGFIIAFVKGWKLTLVMMGILPLMVAAGMGMSFVVSKMAKKGQDAYAEAGNIVQQVVGAIRTVASFTGEKKAVDAYDRALHKAYKASVVEGFASGLGLGSHYIILFCSLGLALWFGSKLIVAEGYTGGAVTGIIFLALIAGMSFGQASPCFSSFAAGQAAAYKVFEVIHRVPSIDIYNKEGLVLDGLVGRIEFRNVDFSYPARPDASVFRNFCLTMPAGITTALVGESGGGKSTVISMIERFYDPQNGEVLIDDIDIRKLHLKWLRGKIGLVSQEPLLFNVSIKENIAYGKEGATLEEIQSALKLANAAAFVETLPQGIDTQVGEYGTHLSGGQKQKIVIARAILKNPSILLLDEGTSALDADSERAVQEALDIIMSNRTTVIVAHRLSTIKNANRIAVIKHGVVIEEGSQSELLENPNGAYSQLVRLQTLGRMEELENNYQLDPDSLHPSKTAITNNASESPHGSSLIIDGAPSTLHYIELDGQNKHGNSFKVNIEKDRGNGHSAEATHASIFRLATLNKPEAAILLVGLLSAALYGAIPPALGLLLSSTISTFFEKNPHKLHKDANFWSTMFAAIAGASLLVISLQAYCFSVAGSRLIRRIRHLTFERVVRQEIGWFDEAKHSSGTIGAQLSADAAQVKSMVGDLLLLFVQNSVTLISGLIIAFMSAWQLTLLILGTIPLRGFWSFVDVKSGKGFSTDAKMNYEMATDIANDAVRNIRSIASFCAEEKVMVVYEKKCREPLKKGIQQGVKSGLGVAVANFLNPACMALCFWYGAQLVDHHKTTYRKVFQVYFALTMVATGLSRSTGLAPNLAKAKAAVKSIFSVLDCKSKIDPMDSAGETLLTVKGNIEFQHVTFKYPARPDVQILNDLCFLVHAGKTVALAGESGSGKSTILSILERFYDPDSGQVLIDGMDIRKFQVRWLRQQIGLVGQEPLLFSGTIRQNIAYGKDGIVADEEIHSAAQASNASKFICSLPHGYDTDVGDRGIQLSGGQKQRIAIARAIVKDPKILLLDEATSALDAESADVVQEALDLLMINRTTIVIAHQLSTIMGADSIAVLRNGVISEKGTHKDLLELGGAYASLVKIHFSSKSE